MNLERAVGIIGPRSRVGVSGARKVNTTSHAESDWQSDLSPFKLGPVHLWDGRESARMENGWQFSKVYSGHLGPDGKPTPEWFKWSGEGFADLKAHRYPMGKGAKPVGSWWNATLLGYIDARKQIYVPLYRDSVRKTPGWQKLKAIFEEEVRAHGEAARLELWDFDGYDHHGKGLTLHQVLHNPKQIMGHAMILAMMLVYGEDFTPEGLPQ